MSIQIIKTYSKEDLNKISSGRILEDTEGEIYLSFAKSSTATGLLSTSEGFLIECEIPGSITWPIKEVSLGTMVTITSKPNK